MKWEDVKKILMANGLTQQAVAEMIGVSRANLNGMLGKDDIRTGLLESISKATGIPMSAFFQGPHGAIDFTQKVDEANRKVIDYIKESVPHLSTQDGLD